MPPTPVLTLLRTIASTALVSAPAATECRAAHELVRLARHHRHGARVDREVRDEVGRLVDRLLDGGWTPAQVSHVVELHAWPDAVSLFTDLAAQWAERSSPSARARAELRDLGASVWWGDEGLWLDTRLGPGTGGLTSAAAALGAVFGVLSVLEPLPFFHGGESASGLDDDVLRKVRALLAKAESTDYPDEAEALSAKAQQLISRHAIDAAALTGVEATEVQSRMIVLDAPYRTAKSLLLSRVADANRCRSVRFDFSQTALLLGTDADLDAVEVLYTSLLTQSTRAMLAHGRVVDRAGRSRTKAFRRSFLLGFASSVGARLEAAAVDAADEVDDERRGAALPVLAARADAVDRALDEAFPSLRTARISSSSPLGYTRGREAGEQADLGTDRVSGSHGELAG